MQLKRELYVVKGGETRMNSTCLKLALGKLGGAKKYRVFVVIPSSDTRLLPLTWQKVHIHSLRGLSNSLLRL